MTATTASAWSQRPGAITERPLTITERSSPWPARNTSFYEDDFPEYYEKLIRRLDPASMGALPPNPRDI